MADTAADTRRPWRPRIAAPVGVALFVSLVVFPLIAVAIASLSLFRPGGHILEIEMRATAGGAAHLFWSDGYTFSGDEMGLQLINRRPGEFERLRFYLPNRPLELLRFDPIDTSGEVTIRSIRVLNADGATVRTIDPLVIAPLTQIARITPAEDGVRILTTPGANDPMTLLKASWLVAPSPWRSLQFVTPFALTWVAGATLALIITAMMFVAKDVRRGSFGVGEALWFAALFLVVLWAKTELLRQYPSPIPYWDQWEGEGAGLYIPWWHDGLTWRQMFTLHNEHRIFFTRLLALTLLVLNGQWDPNLQIVVNAVLQSLSAVVLAAILWMSLGRQYAFLLVCTVGLVYAPPFALENALAGFQSPFYFLALLSTLALWLMTAHRPGSRGWWLGLTCAVCCPFTVAGGVFVVAPLACASVLAAISDRRDWRQLFANLVALAAVAAVAYAGLPPPIPYHEDLKASSVSAFGHALARNLAFPWINVPWATAIMWLPLVALMVAMLARRLRTTPHERLVCALSVWVLAQAAAIAYSRGIDGIAPASRYLDLLSLGFVANTAAIAVWLGQGGRWARVALAAVVAVWVLGGGIGIATVSQDVLATTGQMRAQWSREHIKTVRDFVATGNVDALIERRGPQELPYHTGWMLANWLQHPYIQRILPAIVRTPLPIEPVEQAGSFEEQWPRRSGETSLAFDSYGPERVKNVAHFESQAAACTEYPYLRFDVAGAARDSGLRLLVRAVRSGKETSVRPAPGSRPGWTGAIVRCPDGPFTVVAADESRLSWLAFRPPAEVARASAYTESIIQESRLLGIAALAAILLAVVWAADAGRRIRMEHPSRAE